MRLPQLRLLSIQGLFSSITVIFALIFPGGPVGSGRAQETAWPVRWAGLQGDRPGQLKWVAKARKWQLSDPAGVEVSLDDVQAIEPAKKPDRRASNYVEGRRTTAILSYQESLTGQVSSIDEKRLVQWQFFGKALQTPLDLASGWSFHSGCVSFLSDDFENQSDKPQASRGIMPDQELTSPAGPKVWNLSADYRAELPVGLRTTGSEMLFQVAFMMPGPNRNTGLTMTFQSNDKMAEGQSIGLMLEPSTNKIVLKYDPAEEAKPTVQAASPGWHWFHLEMKPGRTRFCIDGNVIHEMKSSWYKSVEIKSILISGSKNSAPLIDGIGLFQADEIATPVQRPQGRDLIQVAGGHEWYGEFLSLDNGQMKFRVGQNFAIPAGQSHAILPAARRVTGQWAIGPVARVRFLHGMNSIWKFPEAGYFNKIGLLKPPPEDESCIEGVVLDFNDKAIVLGLSQGNSIEIPADRWTEINPVGAQGVRVLESRPHHLGDEVDMKVIPPEPEGGLLSIVFNSTADEAKYNTRLAVDTLEVLGTNIQPFVESLKKGELITEIWLNEKKIDNLNSHVLDKNDKPARVYLEIPRGVIRAGENRLEFRQKGLENDAAYLDDLSILGVRLYRVD